MDINQVDILFKDGRYYKRGRGVYISAVMKFAHFEDYKVLFKITSKKFDWKDIEFLNDAGDIPEEYKDYPKEKGEKIMRKIAMIRELSK